MGQPGCPATVPAVRSRSPRLWCRRARPAARRESAAGHRHRRMRRRCRRSPLRRCCRRAGRRKRGPVEPPECIDVGGSTRRRLRPDRHGRVGQKPRVERRAQGEQPAHELTHSTGVRLGATVGEPSCIAPGRDSRRGSRMRPPADIECGKRIGDTVPFDGFGASGAAMVQAIDGDVGYSARR